MKPVEWLKSLEHVPQRSPERDALIVAINRHGERLRELNDLKAALSKALDQATQARGVIARAEAAEAEAEDADVQALVSGNDARVIRSALPCRSSSMISITVESMSWWSIKSTG